MEFRNLHYEVAEGIATIKINRPKALNALDGETMGELEAAVDLAGADDSVAGLIITGAGDKSFVAGADIKELSRLEPLNAKDYIANGQRIFSKIANMNKPVVAGVNGFALGGGCELAMACHIRYAHSSARFGQPEVNLGLIPGYGGTQRLARLIGLGPALELILSAEMIKSERAFQLGLVNAVFDTWKKDENGEILKNEKGKPVPDMEAFLAEVRGKLKGILAKGPVAVRLALEAARRGTEVGLEEGLRIEADLFGIVCTTEDFKEGTSAFLEKRPAKFTGK